MKSQKKKNKEKEFTVIARSSPDVSEEEKQEALFRVFDILLSYTPNVEKNVNEIKNKI